MNTSRGKSVSYQKQRFVHQSAHHSPPLAARPSLSVTPDCRRGSFTLIEILVVITIIGILAGMVFKMMGYAGRQSQKAQTIQILEKVAHALEEYKAEYGQYPPVNTVGYEYENTNTQAPWLRANYIPNPGAWDSGETPRLYDYGLVAHFVDRERPGMAHNAGLTYVSITSVAKAGVISSLGSSSTWIPDTGNDSKAKARWAHFVTNIVTSGGSPAWTVKGLVYSNSVETIVDAWGKEIHYESPVPFLTYKLWSSGLDGATGTVDDIHKDGWDD